MSKYRDITLSNDVIAFMRIELRVKIEDMLDRFIPLHCVACNHIVEDVWNKFYQEYLHYFKSLKNLHSDDEFGTRRYLHICDTYIGKIRKDLDIICPF